MSKKPFQVSLRAGDTFVQKLGRGASAPSTPLQLSRALLLAGVLLSVGVAPSARAAYLLPSGTVGSNELFGFSVGISGETVYVGAPLDNGPGNVPGNRAGAVFVYRNISTATGTVGESSKLYSTGESADDQFGYALSLSGTKALVTAGQDDSQRGSGWVISDINAATPTQVKLAVPAPPFVSRYLGASASLSGNEALIGTNSDLSGRVGQAYLYRNVDTTPVQTELVSSDSIGASDRYGEAVGLSGDIALVGAPTRENVGAVYMFQNLGSATPTQTKIVGFDTDGNDYFGGAISMAGTTALVGAKSRGAGFGNDGGAAYVIRNLDATQVQTKLVASDAQLSDQFGVAVSLSGNTALVGANGDDGVGDLIPSAGAAYLFFNVDAGGANATVTEDLKIFASNSVISAYGDKFGSAVAIDGDNFVVGAYSRNSNRGAAYTGSVSSMTTLDVGNATRSVDAISFISRGDWIIGQTTDGNTVQLTTGDAATVTAAGKAVYIGRSAGSDGNKLIISGTLTANEINIGSSTGNESNTLQLDSTAVFGPMTLRLADDNFLRIQGNYTDTTDLLTYLSTSTLQVWDGDLANWISITGENASDLISASYSSGYTTIQVGVVPEPSTVALLVLGGGVALLTLRRRKTSAEVSS